MSAPAAACVVFFVSVVDTKYRTPVFILFPALLGIAWMYLVQYFVAALSRGLAHFGTVPQLARSRHANHPGLSRTNSMQRFPTANSWKNLDANYPGMSAPANMQRTASAHSWSHLLASHPRLGRSRFPSSGSNNSIGGNLPARLPSCGGEGGGGLGGGDGGGAEGEAKSALSCNNLVNSPAVNLPSRLPSTSSYNNLEAGSKTFEVDSDNLEAGSYNLKAGSNNLDAGNDSGGLEAGTSSGGPSSATSESPQAGEGDDLFLWRQWHGSGRGPPVQP